MSNVQKAANNLSQVAHALASGELPAITAAVVIKNISNGLQQPAQRVRVALRQLPDNS